MKADSARHMMDATGQRDVLLKIADLLFPYALILIAAAGLSFVFVANGRASAINSLIYAIPILLVAVILLLRTKKVDLTLPVYSRGLRFSHLTTLYILLFVFGIIELTLNSTRPPAYFLAVSLMSGIILVQILRKRQPWTDCVIIAEIVGLSLNLVWGLTLKYPLYFGYTDTLLDLRDISTVVLTGHASSISFDYRSFPLFYIFNAMASEATGLSARTSLFIFMGFAWQLGTLFAFLIVDRLTNSRRLALITCVLFALSSEIVFYGSYTPPRSLAFVFVLAWLYLILRTGVGFIFMSLVVMCALILTHQLTVFFVLPVLALIYLGQKILSKDSSVGIPLLPVLFLFICFFGYLMYPAHDFFATVLPQRLTDISSSQEAVAVTTSKGPELVRLLYYSFVLLLSLAGIGFILKARSLRGANLGISGMVLASLTFLPLYVTGPVNTVPLGQSFLTYRLPLLVSPFIIIGMACGIVYLISFEAAVQRNIFRSAFFPLLTLGLVMGATFFSTVSNSNASDYHFSYPAPLASEYFTTQDLQSFSFMNRNADPSEVIYGDYETYRNDFSLSNLPARRILSGADVSSIRSGYIVLRTGEMKRTGGLDFAAAGSTEETYRFYTEPPSPQNDILKSLSSQDAIYANGGVDVFMVNPPVS